MTNSRRVFRSLLVGGWVLMMPPAPLGTSLPPVSEWKALSVHETQTECARKRATMRSAAKFTVERGANTSALDVATALAQLEAQCVERKEASPPAPESSPPK